MLVSGITPIATAARAMSDPEMLLLLLEAGADPNWEYPSDGNLTPLPPCNYHAVTNSDKFQASSR